MWIPKGFAHGFISISESADVLYKTTGYWNKAYERCIRWNDPNINITWPNLGREPELSEKDFNAPFIKELKEKDLY